MCNKFLQARSILRKYWGRGWNEQELKSRTNKSYWKSILANTLKQSAQEDRPSHLVCESTTASMALIQMLQDGVNCGQAGNVHWVNRNSSRVTGVIQTWEVITMNNHPAYASLPAASNMARTTIGVPDPGSSPRCRPAIRLLSIIGMVIGLLQSHGPAAREQYDD